MIATRLPNAKVISLPCAILPHRAASIRCSTAAGTVLIVGLYVPSRGPIERRNVDKRAFQDQVAKMLPLWQQAGDAQYLIIGGDLNVIEREHKPAYPLFGEWEYAFYEAFANHGLIDAYKHQHPRTQEHSWFGRAGDGYRFDHFFVSNAVVSRLRTCVYHHDARQNGLSDHSAMYLHLQ
jgi:exodeoxyribonuclease-3